MKCVKKGDVIKRVSNDDANRMVDEGWQYCSKNDYRAYRKK